MKLRLKTNATYMVGLGLVALSLAMSSVTFAADVDAYPPLPFKLQAHRVDNTDVYYVMGETAVPAQANAGLTANAGFVVTNEGVVVFDALGTPALGKALIAAIRQHTDQPIRYVVASHYHADHIYGLQAFRDETSAVIIAQHATGKYRGSIDAAKRLTQRQVALAPWVNDKTRVIEPDITFKDDLIITLGEKVFHIVYAGPAHAPGDSMMMVKPSGALFTGDIVQNHRIPFMNSDEVDTRNWLAGLKKVGQMKPNYIIPGHGEPSDDTTAAIQFTQNYIAYVRSQMKDAVKDWQPFDKAYDAIDWTKYEKMTAFDDTNRGNAYRVYLDMEKSLLN